MSEELNDGRALIDDRPVGARGLKNLPVVGTVAAVLFMICAIGGTGVYQQMASASQAELAAQVHIDRMEKAASESCTRLSPAQRSTCVAQTRTDIADKVDDVHRDYGNLAAQQRSAIWATWMGIAAIVGMAVTTGGTYLLLATLRETRRAALAAQDATREAQKANFIALDARRPWVSIDVEPVKVRVSETEYYYYYRIILTNLSDTAVVDLRLSDEAKWLPRHGLDNQPSETRIFPKAEEPVLAAILPKMNQRAERSAHLSRSPKADFHLIVMADFKGSGDDRPWHISREFTCRADTLFLDEDHPVLPDRMTIVPGNYIRVS